MLNRRDILTGSAVVATAAVVGVEVSKAGPIPLTPWFPGVIVVMGPHHSYEWSCSMSMLCPVTGHRIVDMVVAVKTPDDESKAIYLAELTNSLMALMHKRMTT